MLMTAFYGAILGIIYIILIIQVVKARNQELVGVGIQGTSYLKKKVRAHGNFVENVPFTLILLSYCEYMNIYSKLVLNIFGSLLVISRLLHIMGINNSLGRSFGRFYGTLTNCILILILCLSIIIQFILRG